MLFRIPHGEQDIATLQFAIQKYFSPLSIKIASPSLNEMTSSSF